MYVRLLLQALENQPLIRILRCGCRRARNKGKLFFLFQRKRNFLNRRIRIHISPLGIFPAAASRCGQYARCGNAGAE